MDETPMAERKIPDKPSDLDGSRAQLWAQLKLRVQVCVLADDRHSNTRIRMIGTTTSHGNSNDDAIAAFSSHALKSELSKASLRPASS